MFVWNIKWNTQDKTNIPTKDKTSPPLKYTHDCLTSMHTLTYIIRSCNTSIAFLLFPLFSRLKKCFICAMWACTPLFHRCILAAFHYDDVIMSTIVSQITSLRIVYSTIYSGADQSKQQSSASLAFVWGIHRGPGNSPHKLPVTRKMFPFDDVIMLWE